MSPDVIIPQGDVREVLLAVPLARGAAETPPASAAMEMVLKRMAVMKLIGGGEM
jgi:hypothetical protein